MSEKVKKIKRVVTAEEKKKTLRLVLIIAASLLAAVLVTGVILGCVSVKAFTRFDDYSSVTVYGAGGTLIQEIIATDEDGAETHDRFELNKLLREGLKKTRFSILRGVLEGTSASAPKFKRGAEKDADTGKYEKLIVKGSEIASSSQAGEGAYLLEFVFAGRTDGKPDKSIEVEGERLFFDRARVAVAVSPGNIIEQYVFYLYDSERLYGEGSEYYEITPVTVKAKATALYDNIAAIKDYLTAA
jgi:hypothetical protein